MRRIGWTAAFLIGFAFSHPHGPALAYDETARAQERADLFAALKAAPSERIATAAVSAIWEHWQTAPDAEAQRLLNDAQRHIRAARFDLAMERLDTLIAREPDYAEGWNTRATTLFLQGKYAESLADVETTLSLEPRHFGALSGKAMILKLQDQTAELPLIQRRLSDISPVLFSNDGTP
jgi:tetratricopeptide (TPR) repeat protein